MARKRSQPGGRAQGVLADQYEPMGSFEPGNWIAFAVRGEPVSHPRMTRQETRPPLPPKVVKYFNWREQVRDAFISANSLSLQFDRCSVALAFVVKRKAKNDLDNLVKAILDSLTGFAWKDDRIGIVPIFDSIVAIPEDDDRPVGAYVEITALGESSTPYGNPTAWDLINTTLCEAISCPRKGGDRICLAENGPGAGLSLTHTAGRQRWPHCKFMGGELWEPTDQS